MAELNNSGAGQWSETDAGNISSPPDGAPAGTFPSQAEGIWRAIMGALKRFWDRVNGTVTTTGSAGAYVYTPANASFPTVLVTGETYAWRANAASSGNDTLNVNALGAKPIYKPTTSGMVKLAAGDIQAGQMVQTAYDASLNGAAGGFHLLSPVAAGAAGTVSSVALTMPAEFSVAGSPVTTAGTLAVTKAAQNPNLVFAGPASGGAAAPTFRAVVPADFGSQTANLVLASPASGAAAAPTFRALVAADLPTPAPTTLGGVKSLAGASHKWINSIGTDGGPTQTQPDTGDLTDSGGLLMPTGAVIPFAGSSAPTGWHLCDGSAVSRSAFSALFSVIGTTYGAGDGSTTFNLPDLRGRAVAGVDNMGGTSANRITSGGSGIAGTTLGATGGTETVTLTTAQMPSHSHSVTALNSTAPIGTGACGLANGANAPTAITSTTAGSSNAHQNTQPTIMLNYIIKS